MSKYLLNFGLSLQLIGFLFSISKSILCMVFTVAGLLVSTTILSDMLIASGICQSRQLLFKILTNLISNIRLVVFRSIFPSNISLKEMLRNMEKYKIYH